MNPSRLLMLGLVLLLSGSVFGMKNEFEQYVDAVNNYVKDSGEHSYELIPATFEKVLGKLGIAKKLPEAEQKRSNLKQFLKYAITIVLFVLMLCFVGSFAKGAIKVSLKVLIIVGLCLFLAYTLDWVSLDQMNDARQAVTDHMDNVTEGVKKSAPSVLNTFNEHVEYIADEATKYVFDAESTK
eukprot:1155612_1